MEISFVLLLLGLLQIPAILCINCNNPLLTHSHLTRLSFEPGERLRFECPPCNVMRGDPDIKCTWYGTWSHVPECISNSCPTLENPFGDELLPGKWFGEHYEFVCSHPRVLNGSAHVYCQCDGTWSSPAPQCLLPTETNATLPPPVAHEHCDSLPKIHGGYLFPWKQQPELPWYLPGDHVIVKCKKRYRLRGERSIHCLPTFRWDKPMPTCEKVVCQKLPVIDHASTKTDLDGSTTFRCLPGYKMVGEAQVTCLSNATWSHKPPLCIHMCEGHVCDIGEKCEVKDNNPICVCKGRIDCEAVYRPICASNARTFKNECQMKAYACSRRLNLTKVANGACKPGGSCLIVVRSRCRARIPVYQYIPATHTCERRNVGGCHRSGWLGYATAQHCMQDCADLCVQPEETGPCTRSVQRWRYNSKTDSCQQFHYGGCFGNNNNFKSETLCTQACQKGKRV